MHSLREGDTVNVKGPFAKLAYQPNKFRKIGMIAGGTGIAPMIQVLETCLLL
jgi:cytochrome-b5 reductase